MTEKLYYKNSYINSFRARIISCEKEGDVFAVVLDRTAFFPEGGGQAADTGHIGSARISDVQIKNGNIIHYSDSPLAPEEEYDCTIDWETRFRRMQNHSGEHIVSGIAHTRWGCSNVGFHMSGSIVTVDFDHELSSEQIYLLEELANRAVQQNLAITASFPPQKELEKMVYRSKLELDKDIRIVTIDGIDVCACCAPHVSQTGEIGVIKILSSMKHRGGTRFTMTSGQDAFEDYRKKHFINSEISSLLSSKSDETVGAVKRVLSEIEKLNTEINALKAEIIRMHLNSANFPDKNVCFFVYDFSPDDMRLLVNKAMEMCSGCCAAFCGDDENGYKYVVGSKTCDMTVYAKKMNIALSARGGGKATMIQGSTQASKKKIQDFFNNN